MQMTPFAFGDNMVRVQPDAHGGLWFVAKDVCKVLELSNVSKALSGLDDDEKGVTNSYTLGGEQEMLTISESGLYSLVFRSRKPEAKAFSKWVRTDVLPALRTAGRYALPHIRPQVPTAEETPVPALPCAVRQLKPAVRAAVLNAAVQVAKMGSGTQEEVELLFRQYSVLIADGHGAGDDCALPESVQKQHDAFCTERDALQTVQNWMQDAGIWPARKGGRKVQCKALYASYCRWCGDMRNQLSLRRFGQAMRRLCAVHVSNRVYYWIDGDKV